MSPYCQTLLEILPTILMQFDTGNQKLCGRPVEWTQ